jgi:hypothetical protein
MIKLRDLKFRSCEGYYSKSARACTWPCSITQADPNDELTAVYEAIVHWADVIIMATPIRWGQASSLYFKMAERLNCVQNQITIADRVLIQRKVVGFIITGGQDNIQGVAVVERNRSGAGIDQELHRLAVHRTGDPVVPADAFGHAQLLFVRLGIAATVFTTEAIGTLHPVDAKHRTAAIGADHQHATRTGLTDLHQFALTTDIEHRRTGEQADYPHLGRRPGLSHGHQQQAGAE